MKENIPFLAKSLLKKYLLLLKIVAKVDDRVTFLYFTKHISHKKYMKSDSKGFKIKPKWALSVKGSTWFMVICISVGLVLAKCFTIQYQLKFSIYACSNSMTV